MLLTFAAVFTGCDRHHDRDKAAVRYLYYGIANNDSTGGLYRIDISSGLKERKSALPVAYTTSVAENGVVLFQTAGEPFELKGKCTTGAIVPVPFPVPSDVRCQYVFAIPPRLTLSHPGHHACYPVTLKRTDPPSAQACLALYNCAVQQMTIINVDSCVRRILSTKQVQDVKVSGDCTLIDSEGDKLWFIAMVTENTIQGIDSLYYISEWNTGSIRIISSPFTSPIRLRGRNIPEGALYILNENDNSIFLFSVRDGSLEKTAMNGSQFLSPLQCSHQGDYLALWGNGGIELYDAAMRRISTVLTSADITRLGNGAVFKNSERLSISPDGIWIAFALPTSANSSLFHIFIVRRDGSELQRIADGVSCGVPVISDDVDPL